MWSLRPCSVPSAMNMLVRVYNVVHYHKQGGSVCVYAIIISLAILCFLNLLNLLIYFLQNGTRAKTARVHHSLPFDESF